MDGGQKHTSYARFLGTGYHLGQVFQKLLPFQMGMGVDEHRHQYWRFIICCA